MNSHLNIFKPYSTEDREQQLENDLTRALAICLQEDNLFIFSILNEILKNNKSLYDNLFEDFTDKEGLNINIQQNTSSLPGFDHLIAVSVSEHKLKTEEFLNSSFNKEYEPIPDISLQIDNVVIIFEIKPDKTDCTSQLYNQALNALRAKENKNELTIHDPVTPVDLNWNKLMEIATKTLNFEKSIRSESRFLKDFIKYISIHNYRWLPEAQLASLAKSNISKIKRRIETAINQSQLEPLNNRLGFVFSLPWADEVIIRISNEGFIQPHIYPGNTKGQGLHLFKNGKVPEFKNKISIVDKHYEVEKRYHIKLTSFQKYFSGLWFSDKDLKDDLYTNSNFHKYSGRKIKVKGDWDEIESLFDSYFTENYDWRKESEWIKKVINSGKSQFDISFGYELSFKIPYEEFKQFDKQKNDLKELNQVLNEINEAFQKILNE